LSGQVDKRIIAYCSDVFRCHVSRALNSPLVILLQQQSADESEDGIVVGKDAHDLCPSLDGRGSQLEATGKCFSVNFAVRVQPRSYQLSPTSLQAKESFWNRLVGDFRVAPPTIGSSTAPPCIFARQRKGPWTRRLNAKVRSYSFKIQRSTVIAATGHKRVPQFRKPKISDRPRLRDAENLLQAGGVTTVGLRPPFVAGASLILTERESDLDRRYALAAKQSRKRFSFGRGHF
jgi:hypothetical protein